MIICSFLNKVAAKKPRRALEDTILTLDSGWRPGEIIDLIIVVDLGFFEGEEVGSDGPDVGDIYFQDIILIKETVDGVLIVEFRSSCILVAHLHLDIDAFFTEHAVDHRG